MIDMANLKCDTIANRSATASLQDRFHELIEQRGGNYKDCARAIGISDRVAAALDAGDYKSSISLDAAVAIADYFGVSLNYLLGRE